MKIVKVLTFILIILVVMQMVFAQKKPVKQDETPSKEELEQMMKEVENGMEDIGSESTGCDEDLGIAWTGY